MLLKACAEILHFYILESSSVGGCLQFDTFVNSGLIPLA
jgi:hypothetical protein